MTSGTPSGAPSSGPRPAKVKKVIKAKGLDLQSAGFTTAKLAAKFNSKKELIDFYFDKHGTPRSLEYITIIESKLNNTARSHAGALGPWQFMPDTGMDYGLMNDADRMDWNKSTDAAARYLKYLYKLFGCVDLAVMAYNCGQGNMLKYIAKAGYKKSKKDWTQDEIWDVWMFAPTETQDYYLRWRAICGSPNFAPKGKITVESIDMTTKVSTASPHNKK